MLCRRFLRMLLRAVFFLCVCACSLILLFRFSRLLLSLFVVIIIVLVIFFCLSLFHSLSLSLALFLTLLVFIMFYELTLDGLLSTTWNSNKCLMEFLLQSKNAQARVTPSFQYSFAGLLHRVCVWVCMRFACDTFDTFLSVCNVLFFFIPTLSFALDNRYCVLFSASLAPLTAENYCFSRTLTTVDRESAHSLLYWM